MPGSCLVVADGLAAFLAVMTPLSARTAMRVALIVDTSAATRSATIQIRAGVAAFLDALPPEHEVMLLSTGRRSRVRVPPTPDRAKLKC